MINADQDPTGAIRKLSYLLANPPYPPETFGNLLLLHCKYLNYDVTAGLLAENANLTYKYLSQELYDYLEANVMVPLSPEEAYRKLDDLSNKYVDRLRKITKLIQDARLARDNEAIKVCPKSTFYTYTTYIHSIFYVNVYAYIYAAPYTDYTCILFYIYFHTLILLLTYYKCTDIHPIYIHHTYRPI